MTTKPLIIAHRGSSSKICENTMAAFVQAIQDKADGIELDIQLTVDNEIIVFHDVDTSRLTSEKLFVEKETWQRLRQLVLPGEQKIPMLTHVFEKCLSHLKWINVEIKPTTKIQIVTHLADLIEEFDCTNKILISSQNQNLLQHAKEICPHVRRGLVFKTNKALFKEIVFHDLNTLNPRLDFAFRFFRNKLQKNNLPFWIWNANTPTDWKYCIKHRAEAIITDYPDRLHEYLLLAVKKK